MLTSMFFSKIEVSHLYELQILVVEGQETSQNMVKTVRFIKCLYNIGGYILQGTNISPKNGILKMIFLLPRWDMFIPWRVLRPAWNPVTVGK